MLVAAQAVAVFVVGIGVLGPLLFRSPEAVYSGSPMSFALAACLAGATAVGLVVFGSVKIPGQPWAQLGWSRAALGRDLLWGAAGGAVAIGGLVAVLLAVGATPKELWSGVLAWTPQQRLLFLLIGAQAGFVEESLFRGNLQAALERRLGIWPAWALTAVVFAVYHLRFHPVALASKTMLGLVYGALRWKGERSLFAPALAHALVWCVMGMM